MDYERIARALPWLGDTVRKLIVPAATPEELGRFGLGNIARAIADLRQNEFKSARELLESVLLNAGTSNCQTVRGLLHGYLALASAGLGHLEDAAGQLALADSDGPRRAIWSYNRGAVCVYLRRLDEAARAFTQAVQISPKFGQAWAALAVMHALSREHAETETAARNALALKANPPNDAVSLSLMQATLLQGRPIEGAFTFPSCIGSREEFCEQVSMLPPLTGDLVHAASPGLIVFISCNTHYLIEHGIPLMWSIAESTTACRIHMHVMNPDARVEGLLRHAASRIRSPLQTTFEHLRPDFLSDRRIYYSAVRFVRLQQLMAVNPGRLVVSLDADVLVRSNLLNLPGIMDPEKRIGLPHFPYEPVWQEIGGGSTWFRTGEQSDLFLQAAAAFIVENLRARTARWYLDQVALCMAWRGYPEPKHIALCEPSIVCDLSQSDDGMIWAVTIEKGRRDRYNAFKEALLRKYGRPP